MNKVFKYNDGGRSESGYKGKANDCTVRAIAIATQLSYQTVYDDLFELNQIHNKPGSKSSPRNGSTSMKTVKEYMDNLGWTWEATMGIGTGCKVHLHKDELPPGRIVVRVSKHLTCMIDGVIHDTWNPQRGTGTKDGKPFRQKETRCVYGYFHKAEEKREEIEKWHI